MNHALDSCAISCSFKKTQQKDKKGCSKSKKKGGKTETTPDKTCNKARGAEKAENQTKKRRKGQEGGKEGDNKEKSHFKKRCGTISVGLLSQSRQIERRLQKLEVLGEKIWKRLKVSQKKKEKPKNKRKEKKKKEEENRAETIPSNNPFSLGQWHQPITDPFSTTAGIGGGRAREEEEVQPNFYLDNFLNF